MDHPVRERERKLPRPPPNLTGTLSLASISLAVRRCEHNILDCAPSVGPLRMPDGCTSVQAAWGHNVGQCSTQPWTTVMVLDPGRNVSLVLRSRHVNKSPFQPLSRTCGDGIFTISVASMCRTAVILFLCSLSCSLVSSTTPDGVLSIPPSLYWYCILQQKSHFTTLTSP